MPKIIMNSIIGVMLLLCAIQDLKQKEVHIWMIGIGAILICICVPFYNSFSLIDCIGGVLVGGSVVLISKATRGKVGMGDGLILCATGIGLGLWGNLELFAFALFMAAVLCIVLLILRLVDRKKSIPFVPFLFLSYLGILFVK